jgi:plastocyanin
MKKLLAVLVAVCVTGAAMLAIPAFGATRTVSVRDSFFSPKTLKVRKGTTVRWVWRGTRMPHNVVSRRGAPQRVDSGRVKKRGSYSKRLTRKGLYRIHCEIHPGMTMSIRVR